MSASRLRNAPFLLLPLFVLLFAIAPFLPGCASQRPLDPAGPYQADALLFSADLVIGEIGDTIMLIEDVAARNPQVAAKPEVAEVLAKIHRVRDGVVDRKPNGLPEDYEVEAILLMARDAYADAKTQANAEGVNKALQLGKALLVQARQLLPAFVSEK